MAKRVCRTTLDSLGPQDDDLMGGGPEVWPLKAAKGQKQFGVTTGFAYTFYFFYQ